MVSFLFCPSYCQPLLFQIGSIGFDRIRAKSSLVTVGTGCSALLSQTVTVYDGNTSISDTTHQIADGNPTGADSYTDATHSSTVKPPTTLRAITSATDARGNTTTRVLGGGGVAAFRNGMSAGRGALSGLVKAAGELGPGISASVRAVAPKALGRFISGSARNIAAEYAEKGLRGRPVRSPRTWRRAPCRRAGSVPESWACSSHRGGVT